MRRSALALVLALALPGAARAQSPAPSDSVSAQLHGVVRGRFQERVEPLAFAVIEVVGDGYARATVSDSLGHYTVEGLRPGEVRVRATYAGHRSIGLTVLLSAARSTRVDLELRAVPVPLPELDVVSGRSPPAAEGHEPGATAEAPLPEVELQALDVGPGVAVPGLVAAVGALPGNDPADATDVLFMRGSTTDLKLVLLDGVPVYTPFHVAGLLRSFEPSVIERAELHVGGAPARYDGGLTHILDLGTRRARRDRFAASGSIDMLSTSVAAETPIGSRAGLIVSGRSLHDLGSPALGPRPYGYRDAMMSLDADPAPGHSLRATGFWNSESIRLDFEELPGDAEWRNRAGSLAYSTALGDARLDITAGASGYDAVLPLQPAGEPGAPPPPTLVASASVDRARVVAESTWGPPQSPLRLGLAFDRIDARYDATGGSGSSSSRASTSTPGAFVDVTRPLGPGVTVRAGLRGDLFEGRSARLAPRAALYWEVGPEALLTVAVGRYHQPTRTPDFEVERTLSEVAVDSLDGSALLPVATADHVVLSLDQRLRGTVSLGLEGFWKRFEGLQASSRETVRSSGIDVRVLSSGDVGTAWLGYGLSWYWSTVDLSGHASGFAGRHLLSAGLAGRLVGPLRAEARIAYGAGLPYTAVPFGAFDQSSPLTGGVDGQPNAETERAITNVSGGLDEEFLRLDLEIHGLFEPEWGGHRWRVRPYVRVLNALDRRDALFYTFQEWRPDSMRALAERPFLPLLGIAFSY